MKELQVEAHTLGISLTKAQIKVFETYYNDLEAWNKNVNLTNITGEENVVIKHFLDSLTVAIVLAANTHMLLDIGSGAGFPGIPVKIVRPEIKITLLEAVAKKVSFLEYCIAKLKLHDIQAVHGRAEDFGHDPKYREQYDVVTARAVAHLSILIEYALPFLRVGGLCIAQKMNNPEEITEAKDALEILGGKIKKIVPITISGLQGRCLVLIEKMRATDEKYPRRPGLPSKRPL
ncbi:16S rRNA (guanine(527)-N(7))-methyltransferase RsmG [Candidatus Parcubacteria bacterium]|nr:16S rRNA (guanine(527)-N(7))-methyltransferase RsmG [Candidatus Parcubacteria bacterium]